MSVLKQSQMYGSRDTRAAKSTCLTSASSKSSIAAFTHILIPWSFVTISVCIAAEPKGTVNLTNAPNFNKTTPVKTSLLWQKKISGLDVAATAALKPFFDYPFILPEQSLRAGLGYVGATRRLRTFVQDLIFGERHLKIGILGGRCVINNRVKRFDVSCHNSMRDEEVADGINGIFYAILAVRVLTWL